MPNHRALCNFTYGRKRIRVHSSYVSSAAVLNLACALSTADVTAALRQGELS